MLDRKIILLRTKTQIFVPTRGSMNVFDVFRDPSFEMTLTPAENVIMRVRGHVFVVPSSDIAHIKLESDPVRETLSEPVEMTDAEPKPLVTAKRRGRPPFKHPEVTDSGA
jgi:hypothetical protein